jgi:hypothetical protein
MPATGLNRYLPDWSATNVGAIAGQATATRLASPTLAIGESRHVCTSVSATLVAGVTLAAPVFAQLNLINGPTGGGNILASWLLAVPGTPGFCTILSVDSLEIIGSPNTAMTLEFDAGDALSQQSVTLTGHTV